MSEVFTTADGRTLSYERRGSGPLLVCHPGGPGGSAAEFVDFAGLDDTFELVLLSPRGSAGSDTAGDYALASYASDLDELRGHLGVERIDLLGFSHGGVVAMAYAAAHPERVDRLVLASTIARLRRRGPGGAGGRYRGQARRAVVRRAPSGRSPTSSRASS